MARRRRNKKKNEQSPARDDKTRGRTVKVKRRNEEACTTRNPKPIS
jgi:hypothetical protein